VQEEKRRRLDSVEDPGQSVSLLNAHYELEDYHDDASLSDAGDDSAVAETALDSPATTEAAPPLGDRRGREPTTSGGGGSTRVAAAAAGPASTAVKEAPPQSALKLPLDQNDYLQPQSSVPATYLDLVASPGK